MLCISGHLIDMSWLIYMYFLFFQIWRPITCVLFYPISGPRGFHYLINLYFLYSYSIRLETGKYLTLSFMNIRAWLHPL